MKLLIITTFLIFFSGCVTGVQTYQTTDGVVTEGVRSTKQEALNGARKYCKKTKKNLLLRIKPLSTKVSMTKQQTKP